MCRTQKAATSARDSKIGELSTNSQDVNFFNLHLHSLSTGLVIFAALAIVVVLVCLFRRCRGGTNSGHPHHSAMMPDSYLRRSFRSMAQPLIYMHSAPQPSPRFIEVPTPTPAPASPTITAASPQTPDPASTLPQLMPPQPARAQPVYIPG